MELLMTASSEYLIQFMTVIFMLALGLRFIAYRANKKDQLYYSTFTREIEKRVERDDIGKVDHEDIEGYIEGLLDEVSGNLPSRGVRLLKPKEAEKESDRTTMSVREYSGGSQSLIHSLKGETNTFRSKQQPNFEQLTKRVMSKDEHWVKLRNFLPIESVIRMIDVLPGIFIVIGIFGTFVGITSALPQIAQIDFNNVSNSSSVLSIFVKDVSFAMQTSIAGIAFSLIMSLLNTLFPIKSIRDAIASQVEDCLEFLWYFVHGGRGENQQNEAFAQMIVLLENIDEKIEDPDSNAISNRKPVEQPQQAEALTKMVSVLGNIEQKLSSVPTKKASPRSKVSKARTKVSKATTKLKKAS